MKESEKGDLGATLYACGIVLLKIYDKDNWTDDDMMGTLVVPIPAAPRTGLSSRRWYAVDNLFVPNAMGEVEIELSVTRELQKMSPRDFFPSPETLAKWAGIIMGKEQKLNKNNIIVENQDCKIYILKVFQEFSK